MSKSFFPAYLAQLHAKASELKESVLEKAASMLTATKEERGRVFVAGNGGSAAIASHVAVDLTKAAGISTQCFNEAALLTCLSNDFGYECWLENALAYYAAPKDLLILISSSGRSQNMLRGAQKGKELGLGVITLTGFRADNPLRSLGDLNLWVDSRSYNIVENVHQIWLLAISDYLAGLDFME